MVRLSTATMSIRNLSPYDRSMIIKLVVLLAITGLIFITTSSYYFSESSHYVTTKCNIIACQVDNNETCHFTSQKGTTIAYICYSGSFGMQPVGLDANYAKYYTYSNWDSDHYNNCIKNGTIYCSYDNRDIHSSLTTGSQPDLSIVWVIMFISGVFTGGIILIVLLMPFHMPFHGIIYSRQNQQIGTVVTDDDPEKMVELDEDEPSVETNR